MDQRSKSSQPTHLAATTPGAEEHKDAAVVKLTVLVCLGPEILQAFRELRKPAAIFAIPVRRPASGPCAITNSISAAPNRSR
jgi:hypothetical protein